MKQGIQEAEAKTRCAGVAGEALGRSIVGTAKCCMCRGQLSQSNMMVNWRKRQGNLGNTTGGLPPRCLTCPPPPHHCSNLPHRKPLLPSNAAAAAAAGAAGAAAALAAQCVAPVPAACPAPGWGTEGRQPPAGPAGQRPDTREAAAAHFAAARIAGQLVRARLAPRPSGRPGRQPASVPVGRLAGRPLLLDRRAAPPDVRRRP